MVWKSHQEILAMQQLGRQQVQACQEWATDLWQQQSNMFSQYSTRLVTPSLIVHHPPVTTSYVQTQEYRQQVHDHSIYIYPFL